MTPESIRYFADNGLVGVIIFGIMYFVYYLMSLHKTERENSQALFKAERDECLSAYRKQGEAAQTVLRETNVITTELVKMMAVLNDRRRGDVTTMLDRRKVNDDQKLINR